MQHHGIRDKELKFYTLFLSARKQLVKHNNNYSELLNINRGVPQGSALGPFFFVIYMNDFPYNMSIPSILYADDTTILTGDNNLNYLNRLKEREMRKADAWFRHNKLLLNKNKTINILFSLSKEVVECSPNNTAKFLGVFLDSDLSWNAHIDFLLRTLSKSLFVLRKLKFSLSLEYLCLSYHAIFHSHINYSILFWGGVRRMNEIFIYQKKAIRIILGLKTRESCRGRFREMNILTIPSTYVYHAVIYIKSHSDEYKLGLDNHNYLTRNKHKLTLPKTRLEKIRRSYAFQGVTFLNMLPTVISNLSLPRFKIALKKSTNTK